MLHNQEDISFIPSRQKKTVTFRPQPDSGIRNMGQWILKHDWSEIYNIETAHNKARRLQDLLETKLNEYLPEKTTTVTSDDKPWITSEIKRLDRQQKREFSKKKKSDKTTLSL